MIRMSRRSFAIGTVSAVAATPLKADPAHLKVIFPFPAGGVAEGVIRNIVDHVAAKLQRQAIVENRTGAGGKIGALAVKEAPADGSVLLIAAAAQLYLQPHAFTNLGYDPLADFSAVCQIMTFSQGLAVSAQVPADTVPKLVDWLRQNPAHGLYGSPGAGTLAHFAGAEFSRLAKVPLRHLPYRGVPAGLPDLIAGRVPLFIASAAEFAEHHKAGIVRVLGLLDADRSMHWPAVPTLRETGYDITVPSWFSVNAPAGTPSGTIARLEAAFSQAVADPTIAGRIRTLGFSPTGLGSDRLHEQIKSEHARWGAIVKASGFRAEQ